MDPQDIPGSSGVKKQRTITVKTPKKLTDEEMLAYAMLSDSDDSDEKYISSDDELYQLSGDEESTENESEIDNTLLGKALSTDNAK